LSSGLVSCQCRRTLGDDPDDRRRHSRVVRRGGCCGASRPMHPYERRRAVRGLDRSRNCNEMCLAPARAVASRLARGQIGNLRSERYPPFQLLLMSRIQSGDGAARTDAEDEEHKPFSHDLPSSPWLAPSRELLNAPYPFEAGCKLCGLSITNSSAPTKIISRPANAWSANAWTSAMFVNVAEARESNSSGARGT
jgi:hypothetical protein